MEDDPLPIFSFWQIFAGSIVLGVLALVVAFLFAGAGHGTYLPAKVLFTYTMLSTVHLESISGLFLIIALVQYPVYGLILGWAAKTHNFRFAFGMIATLHVSGAVLCFLLIGENFS